MAEKKPLKDWTLGECKECCEKQDTCRNCPLAGLCDEWGLGEPKDWLLGG